MKKHCLFALVIWLGFTFAARGQDQWEEGESVSGEIEDAEIVIEKDREIELPYQPRNYEKVPPPALNAEGLRQDYNFSSLSVSVPATQVDIKALKLEEESLEKYYGNWVKLGYGNYASPLAEVYLYNKRNEKYLYGVQAKHLSFGKGPVDGKNSASGESSAKMEGSYFGQTATLTGSAFYRLNNWRYYGYNAGADVSSDTLLHQFNRYGASLAIDNAVSESATDWTTELAFSGQSDNYETEEYWSRLRSRLSFPVSDPFRVSLDVSADLLRYTTGPIETNRQRVGVLPTVEYVADQFSIAAGLRYVYQSDSALPASQVYPLLKGSYKIGSASVYAEISGDNELLAWQKLTDRNPYIGKLTDIHNANKTLHLEAGLKGGTSLITYKLGFARKVLDEYAYFVNDVADPSKFAVVYDSASLKVLDFFAEADIYLGSNATLSASAHGYNYASEMFEKVPHLPAYEASFGIDYLFFNKIRAKTGLLLVGGISGFDPVLNERKALKSATDLYLHLDYLLSKRATIFLDFRNLANQQYQLLSNYPVRGLTFKGGFSYSF